MSDFHYAILCETSAEEMESWYYFIRYEENEDALETLKRQLDEVRWHLYKHYNTFDLDMDHLVSEQTAREMCKVDVNPSAFHRKFDGTLREIDLGFEAGDKNKKRIRRCFYILGNGKIDEWIDGEEEFEESATSTDSEESESDSGTDSSSDSSESEYSDSEESGSEAEECDCEGCAEGKECEREDGADEEDGMEGRLPPASTGK